MTATIIELIICHTCQDKQKKNDSYVRWEGSIYCESCFDKYLELIDPSTWESSKIDEKSNSDDTN